MSCDGDGGGRGGRTRAEVNVGFCMSGTVGALVCRFRPFGFKDSKKNERHLVELVEPSKIVFFTAYQQT